MYICVYCCRYISTFLMIVHGFVRLGYTNPCHRTYLRCWHVLTAKTCSMDLKLQAANPAFPHAGMHAVIKLEHIVLLTWHFLTRNLLHMTTWGKKSPVASICWSTGVETINTFCFRVLPPKRFGVVWCCSDKCDNRSANSDHLVASSRFRISVWFPN